MATRDIYGNRIARRDGDRVLDNYGDRVYEIRGNRIYDTYGDWKYDIRDDRIPVTAVTGDGRIWNWDGGSREWTGDPDYEDQYS